MTENNPLEDEYDLQLLLSDDFNDEEKALVSKAYNFAKNSHKDKNRESGKPYFSHPYEVAKILRELNMDAETIASGLLHDTIEDVASVSKNIIETEFGTNIAQIVDGLTKISKLQYESKTQRFNENLRKMILYMAKDIRVVIVKLADRLHNMRTLKYVSEEKQLRISKETLEVYSSLASRLGMNKIKSELEDLSMRYIYPDEYRKIANKVNMKRKARETLIKEMIDFLSEKLKERQIPFISVYGRPKHFYSIYRKMQLGFELNEIYDITALRVITSTEGDCYSVLGIVHNIWNAIPNKFKDYISSPKENGYQSIHTSVITHTGKHIEVQIRTKEMHEIAEEGIAAHWKYKERFDIKNQKIDYVEQKLRWISRVKNWAQEMKANQKDFIEGFKTDILGDQILCYTPKMDIVDLPVGATPVDFAYSIHSEIGEKCSIVRIIREGITKIVPLDTELLNFDIVEIITGKNSHPTMDWLNFVKTNRAKNKIKQWFRSTYYRANRDKGKDIFAKAFRSCNITLEEGEKLLPQYMKLFPNISTAEALYAEIGFLGLTESDVIKKIKSFISEAEENKQKKKKDDKEGTIKSKIIIEDMSGVPIKFAKCCNPILGDDIAGFVTKINGISIHKENCQNFQRLKVESEKNNETGKVIKVKWKEEFTFKPIRINVIAKNNEEMLSKIYEEVKNAGAIVVNINTHTINNNSNKIYLTLRSNDKDETGDTFVKLIEKIEGVIKVSISK